MNSFCQVLSRLSNGKLYNTFVISADKDGILRLSVGKMEIYSVVSLDFFFPPTYTFNFTVILSRPQFSASNDARLGFIMQMLPVRWNNRKE